MENLYPTRTQTRAGLRGYGYITWIYRDCQRILPNDSLNPKP